MLVVPAVYLRPWLLPCPGRWCRHLEAAGEAWLEDIVVVPSTWLGGHSTSFICAARLRHHNSFESRQQFGCSTTLPVYHDSRHRQGSGYHACPVLLLSCQASHRFPQPRRPFAPRPSTITSIVTGSFSFDSPVERKSVSVTGLWLSPDAEFSESHDRNSVVVLGGKNFESKTHLSGDIISGRCCKASQYHPLSAAFVNPVHRPQFRCPLWPQLSSHTSRDTRRTTGSISAGRIPVGPISMMPPRLLPLCSSLWPSLGRRSLRRIA
ncbi:hypothetical protein N657DRAFT_107814 [Parathielavia appendiculata]|uniref:Uncharacterized protein n=1 Tax=Parathielavia appendiculata TaxID=2587402 RepID=A0AAN6TVH7_9PEZI|nr:hypothetical protein N657DRAFT_107814 [Parathielavia appendiculata]